MSGEGPEIADPEPATSGEGRPAQIRRRGGELGRRRWERAGAAAASAGEGRDGAAPEAGGVGGRSGQAKENSQCFHGKQRNYIWILDRVLTSYW